MARATADFQDVKGRRCSITTLDAANLAEMKSYATTILGYSDAVLTEVSVSTGEMQATKSAGAASNIAVKGIVLCKDERGAIHKITIPSVKASAVEADNTTLKASVVTAVTAAVAKLIGKKCYGLKGYKIQKRVD